MQTTSSRRWRAAILKAVGSALLAGGAALPHSAWAQSVTLPGSPSCNPSMASCAPAPCKFCTPLPVTPGPADPVGPTCKPSPIGNPNCGAGPSVGAGNPINLITGNKYQEETDLAALPGVLGLELKRHYNSQSSHPGLLGARWRMSYEVILYDLGNQIQVVQADGRRLTFQRGVGANAALCTTANLQDGQVRIESPQGGKGQATYHWRQADGQTLTFTGGSGGGHPLHAITAATGQRVTLAYSPIGDLLSVRDPQGRKLSFIYANAADKRSRALKAIDTPLGRVSYTQDSLGRLTEAASSTDAVSAPYRTKLYHYEDKYNAGHKHALTGISVKGPDPQTNQQTEQRLSTYAYNQSGQAILSTKGWPKEVKDGKQVPETGIEQVEIQYVEKPLPFEGKADRHGEVIPKQLGKAILTNSLGQKTEVTSAVIGGYYRLVEMRGHGCSTCGPSNMRYAYNAAGQLVRETKLDDQGKPYASRLMQYDAYGRVARLEQQTYATAQGKSKSTPEPVRWTRRFEYADVKYPDGNVAVAPQPSLIAQPSVIPGKERTTRIAYSDSWLPTRVTEKGYSPTDDMGRPSVQGTPISRTTTYKYASVTGRTLLSEVDGPLPNGPKNAPEDSDITRYNYDARGDYLSSLTQPGGFVTSITRRDRAGRPVAVAFDDGTRKRESVLTLAPTGEVQRIVSTAQALSPDGPETPREQRRLAKYEYDALGRLTAQMSSGAPPLRNLYDIAGNVTHRVLPDGSQLALAYDAESRVTATALYGPEAAPGTQWHFEYRGAHAVTATRSAMVAEESGERLSETYELVDAGDMPWSVFQGGTVGPGSDVARRNLPMTGYATLPDGSSVQRLRDDFGRIVGIQGPQGWQFAQYDAADRLQRLFDRGGAVTQVRRDVIGRPLEVMVSDGRAELDERTQYKYQGAALTEEAHWVGRRADSKIAWAVDAWGRPTGKRLEILPAGPDEKAIALATTSTVNDAGRVIAQTLPSGAQLGYAYDSAGRLQEIRFNGKRLVSDVGYAAVRSGIASVSNQYGNALARHANYDDDKRLATLSDGPQERRLTTDDDAKIRKIESRSAAPRWARRDSRANTPRVTVEDYDYDEQGRLTSEAVDSSQVFGAQYDPVGDRIDMQGAMTDPRGSVMRRGEQLLAYNPSGQLGEVRDNEGALIARYRYDADGIRIAKRVGVERRYFLYEGGRLLAEADARGHVAFEYVHLNGRPVARVRHSTEGSIVEYLHTDQRAAVDAVTDERGNTVWQARLGAWGQPQMRVGAKADMPLRLLGQYEDEETGLYYNVHRYYDPVAGRYVQPDPLGLAAGPSLYAYAAGDPLQKVDPLGLMPEPDDTVGGLSPTLFGTLVHTEFASQVRALGPGWGGDNGRAIPGIGPTWSGLRPDAYFVDSTNLMRESTGQPFKGELWELKPISYRWDTGKYASAEAQVLGYVSGASRGCWKPGSTESLTRKLHPDEVLYDGRFWDIRYVQNQVDDASGLLFYTRRPSTKKIEPVPAPAPAPKLSKADYERLQVQIEQIKQQGPREGWSMLQTIGMVVLIGLAIAALIFLAPMIVAAVSAIIASIATLLAAVSAGTIALMAGLAALFGFSATAVAADAEQKGKEEQQGLLDGVVGWFKGWF